MRRSDVTHSSLGTNEYGQAAQDIIGGCAHAVITEYPMKESPENEGMGADKALNWSVAGCALSDVCARAARQDRLQESLKAQSLWWKVWNWLPIISLNIRFRP